MIKLLYSLTKKISDELKGAAATALAPPKSPPESGGKALSGCLRMLDTDVLVKIIKLMKRKNLLISNHLL